MAFLNVCLTSTAGSPSPLARAVFTYSSRRTSRIAERVVRASTANWNRPSAIAGSSSDLSAGHTPWPQPSKPPAWTQPRRTEKSRISSSPAQNEGTAMPSWERIIVR